MEGPPEWVIGGLLGLLVLLVFGRAVGFEFTNWDDQAFILNNPLLAPDWRHLPQLFRPGIVAHEQLYIPVTYTTYLLESLTFGLRSPVLHSTNILLHAVNTVLLYTLIRRRCSWRAAAVGALVFASHPIQVEAVAWAMGRKDLLATAFGLTALLLWDRWRRQEEPSHGLAVAIAGVFVLGLLSKPSLIILPIMLGAWDLLERRPFTSAAKALLAVLLVGSGIAFMLNRGEPEAIVPQPSPVRLLAAPHLVWHWTERVLLLKSPAASYPWPTMSLHLWGTAILGVIIAGGIGLFLYQRRRETLALAGVWFGLALLPIVQGLLACRRFLTADRYGYLPLFAIGLAAAWWWETVSRRRRAVHALIGVAIAVCVAVTSLQLGDWRNSVTLWQAQIRRLPQDPYAYGALGRAWEQGSQLTDARFAYNEAIYRGARDPEIFYNLGNVHAALGQSDAAVEAYRGALERKPNYVEAMVNLGRVHLQTDQVQSAITVWEEASRYDSPYRFALAMNLAVAYRRTGNLEKAEAMARAAVALQPNQAAAQDLLNAIQSQRQPP